MPGDKEENIKNNAVVEVAAQRMAELLVEIIQAREVRHSQATNKNDIKEK